MNTTSIFVNHAQETETNHYFILLINETSEIVPNNSFRKSISLHLYFILERTRSVPFTKRFIRDKFSNVSR